MSPNRTLPATQMLEVELQDNVVELAHLFGWRAAHFRPARTAHGWKTAVGYDGKGWPDLVLVRERVVWVETKSETGRLSPEQLAWRDWLAEAGAEWHLWSPTDWTDGTVEAVLRTRHA
jgi:VRR-NUC domain